MWRGIDISHYQGNITWSKVNVDFVIIKAGQRTTIVDSKFEEYYNGAKSRNIPVGAYWYCNAVSVTQAQAEARKCINTLKGKKFEYPIYYDIEEKSTLSKGKQTVSAIADAFCSMLKAAGYYPGIYAAKSPLETSFTAEVKNKYSVWVANVGKNGTPLSSTSYKGHDIWQYSWTGRISGISGNVDCDYSYKNFPSIIMTGGYNGYGKGSISTVHPTSIKSSFIPRTTRPSDSDPYWIQVGSGGYNKCIYVTGKTVLPNCTGYAWGRFMEAGGVTNCNLSTANAGLWYGNTADGYERGNTPRLGAVICYSNPGKAGHVAIVEQINADGSILISESGYQSASYFWTSTRYPPDYKYGSTYIFQGFIYNPNVSNTNKVESFIKEAKSKINLSFSGKSSNKHDCSADFVVSCADAVGGLTSVIIPDCIYPSEFAKKGIDSGMGSFISSSKKSAQPGDIILIRDIVKNILFDYDSECACDDIGIVVEANTTKVVVVMAESRNKIKKKEYSYSSDACYGFYRPNWSKVDNNASLVFGYGSLGKFYDTENTEEDATIREVGYLSNDYEPTTRKSKIRLSVVNYTTMMSAIMDDLLVPMMYSCSSDNVILDGVTNQNTRIIISQLISKGLNAAAAVGICGNIKQESGFNPAAVNSSSGASGICQWLGSRRTAMIGMVGTDWKNNLTGQIDYLWYELTCTSESAVMPYLQAVPNTESGAREAAEWFVRKFERCGNYGFEVPLRQKNASEIWSQIVIQMTSTGGNSGGIMNTAAMGGTTVEIPSNVNQSGIIGNYTYYDRAWAGGSIQRQIYNKWVSKGKPQNRNIATLDGYYMCAVAPVFGTTGDKVSVVLEDETVINCILADAKGTDAKSKWGHILGSGQVDIIEWEALVGHPSEIDLSGWGGKKVKKIINAGKYQI